MHNFAIQHPTFQHINGVEEIDDKLRKLFVGGLSEHTTEESSKDYFSQYGEVENINILRYDDGKSRSVPIDRCFS